MTDQQPRSVPPPPTMSMGGYGTWQPTQPTQPTQPGPRRRVPGWIVAVASATAVTSVVAFLTMLLWPATLWPFGDRHVTAGPLEFHGFAHVERLPFAERSHTTLTGVHQEHGYAAWEQGGDLQVVAYDITSGQQRWQEELTGAPRWHSLLPTEEALLVIGRESDSSAPWTLFARHPGTGDALWQQEVQGDDRLVFTESVLAWHDRDAEVLRGLDWESGELRWSMQLDGPAQTVGLTTPEVLAQATDPQGVNLSPALTSDRLVVVTEDRRMRVIDARTSGELLERHNVASPADDLLLAYEDRLFVVPDERGYRVNSYSLLDGVEPPQILYTAPDQEREAEELAACGEGRVCVLDTVPFDDESIELAAVSVADGGELWRAPVPEAGAVIPVGEWVVVNRAAGFSDPEVTVLDDAGQERESQAGVGVRLNDGNLLLFDGALEGSGGDVHATGLAVETGQTTALGRLAVPDLENCAWNDRFVNCVGEEGAEIWRFAEEG